MRKSSEVLILIDVEKALDDGIKFFLSANGVVLTEGDEGGFLGPKYFKRVMNGKREPLPGWEGSSTEGKGNSIIVGLPTTVAIVGSTACLIN